MKALILLFISLQLFAQTILSDTYFVKSDEITIHTLLPRAKENKLLFTIESHKYSKRVKSKIVVKVLKKLGYKDIKSSSRYIKFEKISPIDTSKISLFLKDYYTKKYTTIQIKSIDVKPRGYTPKLPLKYKIDIRKKNYLSHKGVLSIKDDKNKKIFFNYSIEATIKVLHTQSKLKRGNKLSLFNTKIKKIQFDKFRDNPILSFKKDRYQAKRQIKNGKIITIRDIESLDLVHKNALVSVSLINNGIVIGFVAKALQNGKLGDIITILKSDSKKLKAEVVGKKRVEIR